MPKVTNTSRVTPIGLPGGTLVAPGATEDYPNWAEVKDRPNLAFYVDNGMLSVTEDDPKAEGDDEKQTLLAQLKALGINANGNSRTETLQKKLDEARAEQKERDDVIASLNGKGIEFETSESLDDLKAKLAKAE